MPPVLALGRAGSAAAAMVEILHVLLEHGRLRSSPFLDRFEQVVRRYKGLDCDDLLYELESIIQDTVDREKKAAKAADPAMDPAPDLTSAGGTDATEL